VELFRKLDQSEEWQGYFDDDLKAFKARAKTLWAPQHRCSDITKMQTKTLDDKIMDEKTTDADMNEIDVAKTDTNDDITTDDASQNAANKDMYVQSPLHCLHCCIAFC
jgi:hypothetical protein